MPDQFGAHRAGVCRLGEGDQADIQLTCRPPTSHETAHLATAHTGRVYHVTARTVHATESSATKWGRGCRWGRGRKGVACRDRRAGSD